MNEYAYVINAFDETIVFSTLEKAIIWLEGFLTAKEGEILNKEPQVNGDLMIVYEYSDDLEVVTGIIIIEKCEVF